jgi:hypothetical protein
MNAPALLLLLGLLAGGLIGWFTRPSAVDIQIGGVNIEIQGNTPAGAEGGSLTSSQWRHIAIFAGIGAIVGLGAGFAVGRRT